MHYPSWKTLDGYVAPLKDTDADAETGNRTHVLVKVILHFATTDGRGDVLGQQLGLANSVLSVWHAVATNAITRKVRNS